MKYVKKVLVGIKDIVVLIIKLVLSYLGVISQVLGAFLGILASVFMVFLIAGICLYVKVLPDFTEAREEAFDKMVHLSEHDFVMNEDTIIFDKNGKKIGSVNTGRYQYVKIQKISPYIYNGYIAVEDKRFKTHAGVDVLATLRAGVKLLKNNMEIKQGGSTITQQVIKNNLLTQKKSYTRKIAEILLAPVVEKEFSKDKIMEFYCNSNYYGNRCYGVEAASKYYFGKSCEDLEPQEAAMLVSLSNSPSKYDPVENPKAALEKRNDTLRIFYQEGVITKKEYRAAKKTKLIVLQLEDESSNENYITGYAIHCAALALMEKENFAFQYTFENKKEYEKYHKSYSERYSEKSNEIRAGGYKIYTSVDRKKQKDLQKTIDEGLAYNKEKDQSSGKYALQGAAVCVDNMTNYVVAIVGGRGKNDPFNRAYLSYRQSGSSIKPLLDYAPGFETGVYSPSTLVNDHPIENGPKNSGGGYRGDLRIREAVARSVNTIAWQVLEKITPEYGLSFLDQMHFHGLSYVDNDSLAISLGGFTEGVRVVDMAKGYSTLANGGKYSDRTCVRKIEHVSDGVIYKDTNEQIQAYSEDAAWLMTDVLKGVFQESYGTGHRLKMENDQICAGKTGTANSGKDVWFCGYTRYYTTVVWAGYDIPRAMPGATGASVTGGMWKSFMDKLHQKLEPLDFEVPDTIRLASYHQDGSMRKGTESAGTEKRTSGKDYFSMQILSEKADYAKDLLGNSLQRETLKSLKKFEEMRLEALEDYYEFQELYDSLRSNISGIEDADIRNEYAERAKNKYDTMKKQRANWKKVAAAYVEAKKAEEELEATKQEQRTYEDRERQIRNSRLRTARARIERLASYKVPPDNIDALIESAGEALEKCSGYSEYSSLKKKYEKNVAYIRGLKKKQEKTEQTEDEEEEEKEGEPETDE